MSKIKEPRQPSAKMRAVSALPVAPSAFERAALQGVALLELENHHCRYPLGDRSPFQFCGAQKVPGSSYCDHHDQLCWVKPVRTKQPYAFRRLAA